MTQTKIPGLLRPGEVAQLLGIDESTVRLADRQGRFEADQRTPGGHRRYDPDATIAFYDELRRWAGKPRASTAEALADPDMHAQLAGMLTLDTTGTGRQSRLKGSCARADCSWVTDLPRSLGTAAAAEHFALRLYAGHYLDKHLDRLDAS